jgi:hypothetical protein
MRDVMQRLELTVNETKTRVCREVSNLVGRLPPFAEPKLVVQRVPAPAKRIPLTAPAVSGNRRLHARLFKTPPKPSSPAYTHPASS